MWISEAAEEAGVNVQTVRYYERRGLLPKAPRRASGYREFPAEAVRTVKFIKRAQELGFSLDEVDELLRLQRSTSRDRPHIRRISEQRVAQIDHKIAELQRMRKALRALVHVCHEGTTLECPIIEALDTGSAPTGGARREQMLKRHTASGDRVDGLSRSIPASCGHSDNAHRAR